MTKRKPLNDALAENFVYGQGEISNETQAEVSSQNSAEQPTISHLLEAREEKEPTKRFTVDLPESMHRKLSILAARTGRKKSEIIKLLLNDLLKDFNE